MQNQLFWIINELSSREVDDKRSIDFLHPEEIEKIRYFHKSFPGYQKTPLWNLANLARELKLANIWVKDESDRFGLKAFKVLGGTYALARYLSQSLNLDLSALSYKELKEAVLGEDSKEQTFVTASDGNHGKGLAWAAKKLEQKAVVFMPKGAAEVRVESIQEEGAKVFVTGSNYDDTVREARQYALENEAIVIQDTAWEGYREIPSWIMQGYGTIADEINEQLQGEAPSHIFLQAGVGSFALAILGYFINLFPERKPIGIILEPENAACFYRSAQINDGQAHGVGGNLSTIMAGLSCGEPNIIAWDIARNHANIFLSCSDGLAKDGVRMLANPLGDDPHIVSGESGALGLGVLNLLASNYRYNELKESLALDEKAKVLLISTEGDTDPISYKEILQGT